MNESGDCLDCGAHWHLVSTEFVRYRLPGPDGFTERNTDVYDLDDLGYPGWGWICPFCSLGTFRLVRQ